MTDAPKSPDGGKAAPKKETPKETFISIVMSFAMVFVFTRFVMASYVIPTGSMAPTLMGAHMRFHSELTGDEWAVNPWAYRDTQGRVPASRQNQIDGSGRPVAPVRITDEVTGEPLRTPPDVPLRTGDRIFVLNYLDKLTGPERWDVVVFKFPGFARENYIKRLVGLPGEMVLLIDGDVFTKKGDGPWGIRRKPADVQKSLWRRIYSSELRPLSPTINGRQWQDRWLGEGFTAQGLGFRKEPGAAALRWNNAAQAIDDWVRYNDSPVLRAQIRRFPVADLRVRAGVEPDAAGLIVRATIIARGHEFQAAIEGGRATLRMRPDDPAAAWTDLASASVDGLAPGRVTNIEFCHVDQSLEVWIDGERVVGAGYEWSPEERLGNAMRSEFRAPNALLRPEAYTQPRVVWSAEGPGATFQRVGIDRDLYYQPSVQMDRAGVSVARGADPDRPLALGPEHFFVLGDNSAASGDGRAWQTVDPWVAGLIDDTPGVVHHQLMMGKAFIVFWPSLHPDLRLPVPDFGRMRWIR